MVRQIQPAARDRQVAVAVDRKVLHLEGGERYPRVDRGDRASSVERRLPVGHIDLETGDLEGERPLVEGEDAGRLVERAVAGRDAGDDQGETAVESDRQRHLEELVEVWNQDGPGQRRVDERVLNEREADLVQRHFDAADVLLDRRDAAGDAAAEAAVADEGVGHGQRRASPQRPRQEDLRRRDEHAFGSRRLPRRGCVAVEKQLDVVGRNDDARVADHQRRDDDPARGRDLEPGVRVDGHRDGSESDVDAGLSRIDLVDVGLRVQRDGLEQIRAQAQGQLHVLDGKAQVRANRERKLEDRRIPDPADDELDRIDARDGEGHRRIERDAAGDADDIV